VDREELMVAVWGEQDPVYDHALERRVLALNQKLAGLPSAGWKVLALPGVGYKLAVSGAVPTPPVRPAAS
jgi:DNA-binding response OmpR family regulator